MVVDFVWGMWGVALQDREVYEDHHITSLHVPFHRDYTPATSRRF